MAPVKLASISRRDTTWLHREEAREAVDSRRTNPMMGSQRK
jgi:hypothetical protein